MPLRTHQAVEQHAAGIVQDAYLKDLVGAGIEPGGLQIQKDGTHRSTLADYRLTRLEVFEQSPELVGPGRSLGERGHLDPE